MPGIKLYGTGSATANAVASVIIPNAGRIIGVQVTAAFVSTTAGAQCNMEISRASAREIAVNGAQQCVCEVSVGGNFVTSGLAQFGINQFFPVNVPVVQGQIIYLHAVIAGTISYAFTAVIWY
jgi:hypothetical protein